MKDINFKRIISPFKDIFNNPVVTKTQSGIQDFADSVKNLFRKKENQEVQPQDINNPLKLPAEIEAEFRFNGDKQRNYAAVSDKDMKPEFLNLPANSYVKPLEEALAGEMEENY
jgi:hypothetical protein